MRIVNMKPIASCSASAQCLWIPNGLPLALSSHRASSRIPLSRHLFRPNIAMGTVLVWGSADDASKRPRLPPQRNNLDDLDMMELKFGRLLGENPQKTWSKVMGRKSNPDVTYLDIEKSLKGAKDLHLEHPLQSSSREGKEQQQTYISNKQSVSRINAGKGKTLNLNRPVMQRDRKQAISPSESTVTESHNRQSLTEPDSKNGVQEVILRKPSFAQIQGSKFMGLTRRPRVSLKRKEDLAKKNLEDKGLLQKPKIVKGPRELNVKGGQTQDSSTSELNGTDIYDVAAKQIIKSGDEKIQNIISVTRPTIPIDPLAQMTYKVDSQMLHGKMENGNTQGIILSQRKEGVSNHSSAKAQTMCGFDSISCTSDKMTNGDVDTYSVSPLPFETKQYLIYKDCGENFAAGAQSSRENLAERTCDMSSSKSEVAQPEAGISGRPSSDHHSETSIEKKLPLPGHHLDIQNPKLQSNAMGNTACTRSVGTEDASDQAMNQSPLVDSWLQKPFNRTGSFADSRHVNQLDRNMGTSVQHNETLSQTAQEREHDDWAWAEALHDSGGFEEVELLSCNNSGFAVSFGSLIGLLPYRELGPKRRPFSFEEWLQQKGLDPLRIKKEDVSAGSGNFLNRMPLPGLTSALMNEDNVQPEEEKLTPMTKEYLDLLNMYNQERINFLSLFIGQKTRAGVTLVDRRARRLILSETRRESQERAEKKANLMDKLNIGDVVTCQVTRITSFGVFVELEGVPALIHRTELSWDPVWDANSFLKPGEVVEAKVCSLDHSLQRINLSLKQMKPDPLLETLESVVSEKGGFLNQSIGPAEPKTEWPELEALISELKLLAGIHSVSKGRFLLSPGLAPTFQVYLSDSHGTQYKLLARSGNRVQEMVVQASLDRNAMKSAIVFCTSRVADQLGRHLTMLG